MFDMYLKHWHLTPEGERIITPSSQLLPVRYRGMPAMLKIAMNAEERRGHRLMIAWAGQGAARVLLHEGDAILMERAVNHSSLIEMAHGDQDDEASRILCGVTKRLHTCKEQSLELVPLTQWFAALELAAIQHGGILKQSLAISKTLLSSPQEIVVLHGDIHHGNVLDFGARGWLAIDPKALIGDRAFDFANIFCNPDKETATRSDRLIQQVDIVSDTAYLEPRRLLQWIVAYAGLSAAWTLEEGGNPETAFTIAQLAAHALEKS